ncbi:MAG: ComEC family competence protein, partial [Brevibacillus sp.]|nr:ComEC family competence protein [Brevibacillus sp.]
ADMMHVPHHGSTSSSSISYIETVKPKIAVINFHRNNSVTKEIYSRYNGFGVQTYHAGVNGNILITSNGSRLEVYTEQDGDFS